MQWGRAVVTLEERRDSCPLHLIFSPSGSLITDPTQLNCTWEEDISAFKRIFHHFPDKFLEMELGRRNRCTTNGVNYVPPKLFDSADATFERIKKLNRAIKTAKQKKDRLKMPPKKRKEVSAKRAESRRQKISCEGGGDKTQRLKHNADYIKGYRERIFDADCKKQSVEYPSREECDTMSTVRGRRRLCRAKMEEGWFEKNKYGHLKRLAPDPDEFGDPVLQNDARLARSRTCYGPGDAARKKMRPCLGCKKKEVYKDSYKEGYVLCSDCRSMHW